jgi:hypothetical protein
LAAAFTILPQNKGVPGQETGTWRFRAKACPGLDPEWQSVRIKKTRQNKNRALI